MTTTTERAFIGWFRPHGRVPWRPVCHGPSAEVVLTKLLDAVRDGDKCVLAGNIDPNERSPTLHRRRL